ncbi:MAG: fatty acid desaturase [Gammaproteobacteria bacterium]|nr:fatty acid desaturase [Gammaproteobacteria bacterium]MDH5778214.1 fatty acid desaturase [Gammaproteobacteria bacterium]
MRITNTSKQANKADSSVEHHVENRAGRKLLKAAEAFAVESVARSWWHVGSTFSLMIAALIGAGMAPWWPLQVALSILAGLLLVRAFITYHDYMHKAILHDSQLAKWLFRLYAAFALTPPRSWRKSHNYHHGHVGKITDACIGAFPIITTKMWQVASKWQRLQYRIQRHPLIVLLGYITIFAYSICLESLFRNPARHWDSGLVLLIHAALISVLWIFGGFSLVLFVVFLPMLIASALGSYLFFAQHSFEHMNILKSEDWTFDRAALESSSYLKLNRIMRWFTGNIGYHHIHHLNVRIPFYRLPEAMEAIPELQSPPTTTLKLRDIINCFRSSLWDENLQRMVSFRYAKQMA